MRSLGEFEQLILWAILRLGDDAYGVPIVEEIQERAGRPVSPGALYTTLGRLEERGMVRSREAAGDPSRGGRPRKYYTLQPQAARAMADARARIEAMAQGMAGALDEIAGGKAL